MGECSRFRRRAVKPQSMVLPLAIFLIAYLGTGDYAFSAVVTLVVVSSVDGWHVDYADVSRPAPHVPTMPKDVSVPHRTPPRDPYDP